jgi:hypothetical protein
VIESPRDRLSKIFFVDLMNNIGEGAYKTYHAVQVSVFVNAQNIYVREQGDRLESFFLPYLPMSPSFAFGRCETAEDVIAHDIKFAMSIAKKNFHKL